MWDGVQYLLRFCYHNLSLRSVAMRSSGMISVLIESAFRASAWVFRFVRGCFLIKTGKHEKKYIHLDYWFAVADRLRY